MNRVRQSTLTLNIIISMSLLMGDLCKSSIPLKTDQVISVPVRCGGLTRLMIKGDKIQDIVVYPEKFFPQTSLHKNGQLYINLKDESQSLQLSLITQNGLTQDLVLKCDPKKERGPIILEGVDATEDQEIKDQKEMELILSLVKKALTNDLENGVDSNPGSQRAQEDLLWKGKTRWSVGSYEMERFETKNKTEKFILLKAEDLRQETDLVVSFDQTLLEPGKKGVLVVVTRKITPNIQSKGDKNE
ncbi:MAG: type-F conjugative transfer system secretin TraK [Alphaproteobacteria bacterium]